MATVKIETKGIIVEVDPMGDAERRLEESLRAVAAARRGLIRRGGNPDTGRVIDESQLTIDEEFRTDQAPGLTLIK